MIPLSAPKVRKLLPRLVCGCVPEAEQELAWSEWRREYQHRERRYHDRSRGTKPTSELRL